MGVVDLRHDVQLLFDLADFAHPVVRRGLLVFLHTRCGLGPGCARPLHDSLCHGPTPGCHAGVRWVRYPSGPVSVWAGAGVVRSKRSAPPVAWSSTRNQPTACTLALWWLKFGPTETRKGERGIEGPEALCAVQHVSVCASRGTGAWISVNVREHRVKCGFWW